MIFRILILLNILVFAPVATAQVELLVRATANSDWEKGDVVVIKEYPATWGGAEGPPDFIRIAVLDVDTTQTEAYLAPWYQAMDYDVLGQDSNDGYRIRLKNPYANSEGEHVWTKSQIEGYLRSWGMVPVSIDDDDIRFDFSVFGVLQSPAFWGVDVSLAEFTEDSYEPLSRLHTVRVDYSATNWNATGVSVAIERAGGEVISNLDREVRFAIEGPTVIRRIKRDFHDVWTNQVAPRRRYIDPVAVDAVLAEEDGTTETTKSVILNYIKDRVDE